MTILLAGGTGLVGTPLAEMLALRGHHVRILTRSPKADNQFRWNPAKGYLDPAALEGVEAVINLAGAGIADKRWTPARKRELIDSRVESNQTLLKAFSGMAKKPHTFVSASAIGYYGNSGEKEMHEADRPVDQSFMVQCCEAWENSALNIAAAGVRTAILRIGVVLSPKGGALKEFIKPMRFGLGAYFGNGSAWYSWIHLEDMCRALVWAVENNQVEGVYNAVAPNPVRNRLLAQKTANIFGLTPIVVPAPEFALRLALGEMSAVVLNSNKVSAAKIKAAGFTFKFPEIEGALRSFKA